MRRPTKVQAKVLSILAVGLTLSFAGLITLQTRAEYLNVLQVTADANRNQTALIASQSRIGLERRDEAHLENAYFDLVYEQHIDRTHSKIAKLHVLTSVGERLKSFESLEAPEISDSLLSDLADKAIKSGTIEESTFEHLTIIAAPVHPELQSTVIGAVIIAWDTTNVVAQVWRSTLSHAALGALAAIATVLAILLAMQRMVVSPLARLVAHVSYIRQSGDLSAMLEADVVERNDEFGALSQGFQLMLKELSEARHKIIEQSETEVKKHSDRLDAALNNMPHGLCMFDAEKRLVLCNGRYAGMYGLPLGLTTPGTPLDDILAFRAAAGNAPLDLHTYPTQHAKFAQKQETTLLDCELQDGRTIKVSHRPMANGGYVASHEDITAAIEADAQIAHMAHHDALTSLPNRVLFRAELERALTRAQKGDMLAVLCLDLDHFKAVNDTLGHPIGDALLKAVADRLQSCVRDTDTVARLGGDEFAIVQSAIEQAEQASGLAQRITEVLSLPYDLDGHQVVIGTSVGIALAPEDSDNADQLLKAADMALYRAKSDGRGTYRFFEAEMDAKMQARRAMELDLRMALGNGEFAVHYQPLINLETSQVSGFEALLRWTHPERGQISPADFIPLAEEIGLISQIGAWVLKRACADAALWPDNVRLAVNLSPAQFKSRTLVLDVVAALGRSGLPAQRLELEITETVMLQDTEATLAILHQLRGLGVRISMDDFGTGYSSLSYLRQFPFDKIKIDQSFIRDLPDGQDAVAIVKAVAGLGLSLGMSTTAEGVETEGQLAKLKTEGCTEVQGWLFSAAQPASEVAALLSSINQKGRAAA